MLVFVAVNAEPSFGEEEFDENFRELQHPLCRLFPTATG